MHQYRRPNITRSSHSRKRQGPERTIFMLMGLMLGIILFCGGYFCAVNDLLPIPGKISNETGSLAGRGELALNALGRGVNDLTQHQIPGRDISLGQSGDQQEIEEPEVSPALSQDTDQAEELDQIGQLLRDMPVEEKVAQMFIVTPEDLTGYSQVTAAGEATRRALKQYPVGGLVYFAHNLVSADQLIQMTANTQAFAAEARGIPIFLSIDEEGGRVARIGNHSGFSVPKFSNMAEIGAARDVTKAYEVGDEIGKYLHEYGINLDYAPNADVLTNPANTVIGDRSFGTDPRLVSAMAEQVLKGMNKNQVHGVLKHFPGHGATEGDTHEGFAVTNKTLEQMLKSELVPFQNGIDRGVEFIMVAHISAPAVTGDNTPCTLSKTMVTDVLRSLMGYDGIVITDALNMGAIQNNYTSEQAAVMAVEAGVDLLLMPSDFKQAYQAVLEAVQSGRISQERIDASVRRILKVKLDTF